MGLGLVAGACGEDPPLAYTVETEANFMASCSGPPPARAEPGDAEAATQVRVANIQRDICECVYDDTKSGLNYSRFSEYDAQLKADLTRELQAFVTTIVANCVTQEVKL